MIEGHLKMTKAHLSQSSNAKIIKDLPEMIKAHMGRFSHVEMIEGHLQMIKGHPKMIKAHSG